MTKQQNKSYADFQRYFENVDETVFGVIRFHLYSEAMIDRIIADGLPRGQTVADSGLSFRHKLIILTGILDQAHDDLIDALSHLNKLRNRCAHELCEKIDESDIEPIARLFPEFYAKLKAKVEKEGGNVVMAMLSFVCGQVAGIVEGREQVRIRER